MPFIRWNPRNYSYGAGSNLGPAALNILRDGKGYLDENGQVCMYDTDKDGKK